MEPEIEMKNSFKAINNLFPKFGLDNKVLVFNFVVFEKTNNDKLKISSYAYGDSEKFYNIILEYTEEYGYLLGLQGIEKLTENLENDYKEPVKTEYRFWEGNDIKSSIIKDIKTRSQFLKEKGYGGCSMTLYYKVRDNIDIGVFVILRSPFTGCLQQVVFNNLRECSLEANIYGCISDLILKFGINTIVQSYKQIEAELAFIQKHKHSIRNLPLVGLLGNLRRTIENNNLESTMNCIDDLDHLNLLRDITTDMMYRMHEPIQKLLIYQRKITTVIKILTLIHKGNLLEYDYVYDEQVSKHPANNIDNDDLANMYDLLINLHTNSLKHSTDHKVHLTVKSNQKCIQVIFTNTASGKNIDNLFSYVTERGTLKISEKQKDKDGLSIIYSACQSLKHCKLTITKKGREVKCNLIIKTKSDGKAKHTHN